jgi:hypothetical protein
MILLRQIYLLPTVLYYTTVTANNFSLGQSNSLSALNDTIFSQNIVYGDHGSVNAKKTCLGIIVSFLAKKGSKSSERPNILVHITNIMS